MPGAVWAAATGAWMLDERVVHLRDPLPSTRELVIMVQSEYSWRLPLHTMRDEHDRIWMWDAVRAGVMRPPILHEIADGLTLQLFGQPRWTVQRLWREALGGWRELDAELLGRGVDVMTLPPDRATNVVFGVLRSWRTGEPRRVNEWVRSLAAPPARVLNTASGTADAAADWLAAAARLNKGAPVTLLTPAGVDSEITIT